MVVPEIGLIFLERILLDKRAEVLKLLRPFVGQFHRQEGHAAQDRDEHVPPVGMKLPHLERRPRHHDRDRGGDENRRVHRADWHVQQSMRPGSGRGIEPEKNVSGEQSAKEHDFRRQKKPDADFRVPEPGVGAGGDCVGNFHVVIARRLVHRGRRFVRFAVALAHRFVLHRKVSFAAREAVFVRAAINRRRRGEISMRRR